MKEEEKKSLYRPNSLTILYARKNETVNQSMKLLNNCRNFVWQEFSVNWASDMRDTTNSYLMKR